MLLMKFLYRFSLPKMNITFSCEVGRGWAGRGEGADATSTSPRHQEEEETDKFDLFLFYMNSKHIMKLKITGKGHNYKHQTCHGTKRRTKLTRRNRTMIDIQETSVSLTLQSSD